MSSLTRFNNENLNDCGKAVFTLIGDNGGESNLFTHYERAQDPMSTAPDLKKVDKIYIEGCIIRNPRDITRQISQNCRLQKVSSLVTYQLQGSNVYTPEKVDEIERIFHSKTLTLNGIDIQFEGGQVFEDLGEDFPNQFKLNVTISECMKWQIFGCGDENTTTERVEVGPEITYAIPARQVSSVYFNDNGLKVADSYEGLLNYYRGQENVTAVTDIDIEEAQTDVNFSKIFKVAYFKESPDPFYYDKFSPSNKVYGLKLSSPDAYNELSRGMNIGKCESITIESFEVISVECTDISIESVNIVMTACEIIPILGWSQFKGGNTIKMEGEDVLLTLSLFNPDFKYIDPITGSLSYEHPRDNEILCDVELDGTLPAGAVVNSILFNSIEIMNDHTFTISGNMLTLNPCLNIYYGDTVVLSYTVGGAEQYIGQIGQINGMCSPQFEVILTSENDSQIPEGATLSIDTAGLVYWDGPLTSYNSNFGLLELKNIKIN